jgi:two-component system, LuxR family, response regulator FixJ
MTSTEPTVFIVDDDPALRGSLQALLAAHGLRSAGYASGRAFLAGFDPEQPGCIVLDMLFDGESGMELLDDLRARPMHPPVIVLTAHGSIPMSVQALHGGAVDFLEKPAPPPVLIARIREALANDGEERARRASRDLVEARARRLSGRERSVAELLITGRRSKQIAAELGISVRTVEGYRARLLEKMEAASPAQLVTMLLQTGFPVRC